MEYEARIDVRKMLGQVYVHGECGRSQTTYPYYTILWQSTELMDEENHPEPQKWMIAHIMRYLESL